MELTKKSLWIKLKYVDSTIYVNRKLISLVNYGAQPRHEGCEVGVHACSTEFT